MSNEDVPNTAYLNAVIRKKFPGYKKAFEGVVQKVEQDDDDDSKIFFIKYEDNDREWVDIDELKRILVLKEDGQILYKDDKAAKKGKSGSSVQQKASKPPAKRSRTEADESEGAAAGTSTPSPSPPPPSAPGSAAPPSPSAPTGAVGSAPPGLQQGTKKVMLKGSDLIVASPSADPTQPESGTGLALTLEGVKATAAVAAQSHDDIVRLGPSTDEEGAPNRYSKVVEHMGLVFMDNIIAEDVTSAEGETYEGQIQQVLDEIDGTLATVGTNKLRLLSVTVHLRNLKQGLNCFNSMWDAWIDQTQLPGRTVVEAGVANDKVLVVLSLVAAGRPRKP